jgi:hypothetical protein
VKRGEPRLASKDKTMRIDEYMPQIIGGRSTVRDRLARSLSDAGEPQNCIDEILTGLPRPLADAEAFLDLSTNLWRYEFGEAFVDGADLIVGSNTWPPVAHLQFALQAMWRHLNVVQRTAAMRRLCRASKHSEVLAEMMPVHHVSATTAATPDLKGFGPGNTDVDWSMQPGDGRPILVEVKSRVVDFLHQAGRADVDGYMPAPVHDHDAMFRRIQGKFNVANPEAQLQGCWINSYITQNAVEIRRAFDALDPGKIHFAILGDWERDATILSRRPVDEEHLLQTFGLVASTRFVFNPT